MVYKLIIFLHLPEIISDGQENHRADVQSDVYGHPKKFSPLDPLFPIEYYKNMEDYAGFSSRSFINFLCTIYIFPLRKSSVTFKSFLC